MRTRKSCRLTHLRKARYYSTPDHRPQLSPQRSITLGRLPPHSRQVFASCSVQRYFFHETSGRRGSGNPFASNARALGTLVCHPTPISRSLHSVPDHLHYHFPTHRRRAVLTNSGVSDYAGQIFSTRIVLDSHLQTPESRLYAAYAVLRPMPHTLTYTSIRSLHPPASSTAWALSSNAIGTVYLIKSVWFVVFEILAYCWSAIAPSHPTQ